MANFWRFLLLLVALILPAVTAQTSSIPTLADMPQCALSCLVDSASKSTCAVTNQTCLCTNMQLQAQMTVCVLGNCTTKEALLTKNITALTCEYPVRDKEHELRVVAIVMGCLSGVFLLLRIVYRLFVLRSGFAGDDWMSIASFFVGIPGTAICVNGLAVNGMGRDIWTLSYATIYQFGKLFYVMEIQYFLDLALLKLTLVFFYLRIFPTSGVRRILWATVVFSTVYGILFVLLAIFQCRPVSFYWTKWDGVHQGHCLRINSIAWANAAISIALDVWILAIPIHQVRKLTLHWKKKIGVAIMFCVGTFVTIVSILRLRTLLTFANSDNPTWDSYPITKWSLIEVNTGIICACMPSFRLLLVHFFPRIFGSTRSHTYYEDHYDNSGANRMGPSGGRSGGRTGGRSGNRNNSHTQNSKKRLTRSIPRSIPLVVSPSHKVHDSNVLRSQTGTITDIACSRQTEHNDRNGRSGSSASSQEEALDNVVSKPDGCIMYSKSYVVEYTADDNDQARLMRSRERIQRPPVSYHNKTVYKGESDSS